MRAADVPAAIAQMMTGAGEAPLLVKVCGVKSAEDATVALRAGAQLIGCIFAPSKRQCSRDEAQAVVRSAASRSVHRVRTRSSNPV